MYNAIGRDDLAIYALIDKTATNYVTRFWDVVPLSIEGF